MIRTVVSFKLDNSTGTVADGMGVAFSGVEMDVESGTGEEVKAGSVAAGVFVRVLTGKLQADRTRLKPMVAIMAGLKIFQQTGV
jgi:hypothetical protein